jgi:hypothetical protein
VNIYGDLAVGVLLWVVFSELIVIFVFFHYFSFKVLVNDALVIFNIV